MLSCHRGHYASDPHITLCALPSMEALFSVYASVKRGAVNFKINFFRDEICVYTFTSYVMFIRSTLRIDTAFASSPKTCFCSLLGLYSYVT
jgi:hypothetical protein